MTKLITYDNYVKQRAVRVYEPDRPAKAILVWLHGGGLEEGSSTEMEGRTAALNGSGIAVVSVDYRMYPHFLYKDIMDDAAAGFAWGAIHNPGRTLFLGGHSAGAYLAAMLALEPRWLQKWGLGPKNMAGCIPVSGQMLTHFRVREERNINRDTAWLDDASPLFHANADAPPWLAITGEHDIPARAEENALMVAALKSKGCKDCVAEVVPGRDHGSVVAELGSAGDPVFQLISSFITRLT